MHKLKRGILISLEGIDGSGKSTLAQALYTYYSSIVTTILTKEPGATPLGMQLRKLLQEKPIANPKAEYLLFAADRAQHLQEIIAPHLAQNHLIISDRMADSSIVYQGYGRGLDIEMIKNINKWAMNDIKPNLTIYVAIAPQLAFERIKKRNEALTTFEQEKKEFFERLVQGFEALYKDRDDVIIINGDQTPQLLQEKTIAILSVYLQHYLE